MKPEVFALTYDREGELLTPEKSTPKCFQNGNRSKLSEILPLSGKRIQKSLNSLKNGNFYSIKKTIPLNEEVITFVIKANFRY